MLFSRSSEQKAQVKVLDVERSQDCSEDKGVGHTQGTCSRRAGPASRSGGAGCGGDGAL